jgi:tripartite ATP-independent transporter DctP family solute receptor
MHRSITRRVGLAWITAAAGLGIAAPHIARAAVRTIRFGQNNTDDSHYGHGSRAFAEAVAADPVLSSALKIEVHGNAELGDELGMLKACVAGTLDMMLCSNSILSNVVPELGPLNAPFLFKDLAHARALFDGPLGGELVEVARAKDAHILAWGENGLRHVTANKPIVSPADLRGLKIRVPQSAVMLEGFRALGADANTLSFSLLPDALRSGQFQAEENPIAVIKAVKLYELQKYLSLTGHIYETESFMASPDLMDDLTPPQRVALAECAKKGAAVTRQVSEAAQRDGIGMLKAAGMTVIDTVDMDAFKLAAQPFLDQLASKSGSDLFRRVTVASA